MPPVGVRTSCYSIRCERFWTTRRPGIQRQPHARLPSHIASSDRPRLPSIAGASEKPRHNRFLRRRQLPVICHPVEGGAEGRRRAPHYGRFMRQSEPGRRARHHRDPLTCSLGRVCAHGPSISCPPRPHSPPSAPPSTTQGSHGTPPCYRLWRSRAHHGRWRCSWP